MTFSVGHVVFFLLIFSRMSGTLLVSPFFANKTIFSMVKVSLIFWISLLIMFQIAVPVKLPTGEMAIMLALLLEFVFGYMIGFITSLIVTSVEFAGTLMDTQAGLSVSAVLDPGSGQNAALLERLLQQIVIIIFLLVDGHHMILSVLRTSFDLFPVGEMVDFSKGFYYLLKFFNDIFILALRLAAPIMLVVFMIDFGFGLLNRVAEQINVFQLGFQVKPIISLLVLLLVIPGLVYVIVPVTNVFIGYVFETFAAMR